MLVTVAACSRNPSSDGWQGEDPSTVQSRGNDSRSQPVFGSAVVAADPPPPISGGTLTVARDGHTAVAADPDRDRVFVADLTQRRRLWEVALTAGDEPGRVVEGADGVFYVALRRGGALATINAATGVLTARTPVCPAPRGVAYDALNLVVHVACAGGELVTVRTDTGVVARTVTLEPDLRDVVVDGDHLLVSRFRAADVLVVGPDGTSTGRLAPRSVLGDAGTVFDDAAADLPDVQGFGTAAAVAWRIVAAPGGGVYMVHQTAGRGVVQDDPHREESVGQAPYGGGGFGGCGGIVGTAVTRLSATQMQTAGGTLAGAVLPVDIAVAAHTDRVVVVAAGNVAIAGAPQLYTLHEAAFTGPGGISCGLDNEIQVQPNAQPVAAAFDGADHLVVQTRQPATLYLIDQRAQISLSEVSRIDTGHMVFHSNSGQGLACASCHPEGGDDGRVWNFSQEGRRRTQNLRGGVMGTEPFHWGGELLDMNAVAGEILHRRMGGPDLVAPQLDALSRWMQSIPRVPLRAPADPAAVARGEALFRDPTVGCATCHAGPQGTNNATVAVGTGAALQVPRLVGLTLRAPYMHDGCAATLRDRFGPCGGNAHGQTAQLPAGAIDDLVAYLSTL